MINVIISNPCTWEGNLKFEHMSKSIILTERTISKLLKKEGKGRRQV